MGSLIFCYFAPPPPPHAVKEPRGESRAKFTRETPACARRRGGKIMHGKNHVRRCPHEAAVSLLSTPHLLPPADLLLIIIAFFIPPHCAFRRRPLSHDFNLEEIPKEIINGSLSREVELRSRRRRDTFCRVLLKCQNVIYF